MSQPYDRVFNFSPGPSTLPVEVLEEAREGLLNWKGAGMSVMLLALLSVSRGDDLRAANVLKNLLSALTGVVAVAVFLARGMVAWPFTLALMAGALLGGFLGGRLVRVLPAEVVRVIVIAAGVVLTILYAWRYWLR